DFGKETSSSVMSKPAAILCPESNASEGALEVILSFFESVKICRPWFMDQPGSFSERGGVYVLSPPGDLKPSGDFKKLLAEYRTWIRTSHDKGFDAFLAFKEQKSHGEEATWEIRAELRRKQAGLEEEPRRNALKWNLTLHLAHEMQEEGKEAEDLLRALKGKDSPLKGVIEEQDPPGLFWDLPEREGVSFLSEAGMSQVLEAWFSLFKRHLSGEEILLTLSPGVFQYLCDTWEEWGEGLAEGDLLRDAVVLRHFPLLKKSPVHVIAGHLSGKTVGHIRDEYLYGK
ncbi:MAG: hypothetical protein ACM335_06950, partial [Deltaproteobacteria bacterium]